MLHPNLSASNGVKDTVIMPPIWFAMFMKPESEPEDFPPRSAETAQNELCERYREPAPPARTKLATRVSWAPEPKTRKAAVRAKPRTAILHRPKREPKRLVTVSLMAPPKGLQTAMARNGSVA